MGYYYEANLCLIKHWLSVQGHSLMARDKWTRDYRPVPTHEGYWWGGGRWSGASRVL